MHLPTLLYPAAAALMLCISAYAEETIKIGISAPLTGEAANYGLDFRDELLFAAEELGGGRYKLIIEDDKCNGKESAAIAHKYSQVDRVKAVIGFGCSSAALAAAPIYQRAGVLMIATGSSAPAISEAGDWIFRTVLSDAAAGQLLYRHIAVKSKKVGILAEETDYAQGIKRAFMNSGRDGGLKITAEDFQPGASDFRTVLAKLKSSGVEGLFINTQTEPAFANVLRQFKELRWPIPVYGAYWPSSPVFLELAGAAAEGIEFVDYPPFDSLLNAEGKALYARFLARYGRPRSNEVFFVGNFEAFRAMHLALQSKEDIREYLQKTEFKGVFGPYRFDSNGDIVGLSLAMMRIEGGKPVILRSGLE